MRPAMPPSTGRAAAGDRRLPERPRRRRRWRPYDPLHPRSVPLHLRLFAPESLNDCVWKKGAAWILDFGGVDLNTNQRDRTITNRDAPDLGCGLDRRTLVQQYAHGFPVQVLNQNP